MTRLSIEIVPRLQREYLRANLRGEGTLIDLAGDFWSKNIDQWYIEGMADGTTSWPRSRGEKAAVTRELIEQWQLSPFIPYYLEVTEIPDCADSTVLLPTCR
ncbi:hypothetical protein [Rhizobium leguminosarum]|uniref:hypothetical protein n=1 Tax=Rhizobium leguminosarum TaxID=384 RepID=UPI001FD99B21|nr:hypothetical protein [Rhizobium leguminosarum]